ncbi:MAG TPA: hypothetical protein VHL58_00950 [Thermoanaerobaculia bacterium]|nr:hypothetical protein [Thermoanaerobaculia bacterium]
MSTTKTVKPVESPVDSDPVSRLIQVLGQEGFTPVHDEEEAKISGERIYRRSEKVLFAEGETQFHFINYPTVSDKVLGQAMKSIGNLFRARTGGQKALSVLQTRTVYVCIVAHSEAPHNENLTRHIWTKGGAVLIPVIIVPEINQVVYPSVETKVGTVKPRVEYLQYLLGERREAVDIHQGTIKTFYISLGFVGLLVLAAVVSMFL